MSDDQMPTFWVEDYGPVAADGKVDCAPAFQAAIDAWAAGGGVGWVGMMRGDRGGTYLLGTTVMLTGMSADEAST